MNTQVLRQITAKELRALDPKRFDKEYYSWLEYAGGYDWWDYIEQNFTDAMAAKGVRVDKIFFSVGYSQSDYAGFRGRVDAYKWMCNNKDGQDTYADKYPALAIAAKQDGSHLDVDMSNRGYLHFDLTEYTYNTDPDGIFQHLDPEAWEALVAEQLDDADLEANITAWVEARCHELRRELEDGYEDVTSVEAFLDSCECNEVTFEIKEDEYEVFA
jgi:hypothetical protein